MLSEKKSVESARRLRFTNSTEILIASSIEWLDRNFSNFSIILLLDFSEILNICQN